MRKNEFGQAIGDSVADWGGAVAPTANKIEGRYCYLERLETQKHAKALYKHNNLAATSADWTYLSYGPFDQIEVFTAWVDEFQALKDPYFFAIIDNQSNEAVGVASFLRIDPPVGSIEVGHINFSQSMQQTPIGTEAMYLMMKYAFELGYRRYEWKCDALNERSCKAALRLGMQFEGIFRQCTIYKERNRDTAWFSILDYEWPAMKERFEKWLSPNNFDDDGHQKVSLSQID